MAVISSPVYDPTTTATKLATNYVASGKAILDDQTNTAAATQNALSALSSAMSAFQSSLSSLVSSTAGVTTNSATFSNTTIASGSANSAATAGTYSFYVEQLATSGQVSYSVNDSVATNAGALSITLADGSNFQVDLANADNNMDGKLSAKEIAAAVNIAANNSSRVTASTLTVNGQPTLVLTSTKTGAANAVTSIDTSGLNDPALQADLDVSKQKLMTIAKDAIVRIGDATGTAVQQASNTFSIIDNVKFTISHAQNPGDAAVTLTVASDPSSTSTNVQGFVDAYNKLNTVLTNLASPGDPAKKIAAGAFSGDAGVAALRARLSSTLRAVTGGASLISFGITAKRDGSLSLDSGRLTKAMAANPGALDGLFGKAGLGAGNGVLGSLDKLMTLWTSSTGGQLNTRKDSVTKQQASIATRQDSLQLQYDNAYKRYLAQFTSLQNLQSQMTSTSNMFTAMFSPSSSN